MESKNTRRNQLAIKLKQNLDSLLSSSSMYEDPRTAMKWSKILTMQLRREKDFVTSEIIVSKLEDLVRFYELICVDPEVPPQMIASCYEAYYSILSALEDAKAKEEEVTTLLTATQMEALNLLSSQN